MKKWFSLAIIGLFVSVTMVSVGQAAINDVTSGTNKITAKVAGGVVTPTEFNNITGTIRGIYNIISGRAHLWGINTEPRAGITLDLGGSLQLGVLKNPVCNKNKAGAMYFDEVNSHFWYCDGDGWRQLDAEDCDSCNGLEYTCTDENGDGTGDGVWTGGGTTCTTVDYDESGVTPYDSDLASTSVQTLVCASSVPDDGVCQVRNNINCLTDPSSCVCIPIDFAYETKCVDGNVWQFDDCGNPVGSGALGRDPLSTCTDGCVSSFTGVQLPDGSEPLVHPMHPEYTAKGAYTCTGLVCTQQPCDSYIDSKTGYAMGCRHYDDPYPNDSYTAGREPNIQIQAFCGEDVSCGSATDVIGDTAPSSSLCDAGTVSDVLDGWWVDGINWQWSCDNGGDRVMCYSLHVEWMERCEGGVKPS